MRTQKKKGVKMFLLCAGNLGRDPAHKEHPYGNDIFWGKDIRRGIATVRRDFRRTDAAPPL